MRGNTGSKTTIYIYHSFKSLLYGLLVFTLIGGTFFSCLFFIKEKESVTELFFMCLFFSQGFALLGLPYSFIMFCFSNLFLKDFKNNYPINKLRIRYSIIGLVSAVVLSLITGESNFMDLNYDDFIIVIASAIAGIAASQSILSVWIGYNKTIQSETQQSEE